MARPRLLSRMTLTMRDRLLATLRERGPATRERLARDTSTSKHRIQKLLGHLTQQKQVRPFPLRSRTHYLLPTPEFEACDCDGACIKQAILLSRRPLRRLWLWLWDRPPCDSVRLQEQAKLQDWSRSTMYHHLSCLQDLHLVRRIPPPHGDRRIGWYEAQYPLPSALSLLRHHLRNIGQTDEDSSTAENSIPSASRDDPKNG